MKIKNISKNTIFIEDLDMYIPYRDGETEDIPADHIKRSRCLRSVLKDQNSIDIVDFDPNEKIESSLVYFRSKQSKPQSHYDYVQNEEDTEDPGTIENLNSTTEALEIKVHGIFYDAGGYGKVNRNLARKLKEAGHIVKIDPKRSQNQLSPEELVDLVEMEKVRVSRSHILIDSIIPSFAELSTGKYRILYTTIESYTVPQQFIECCALYDEIWVTSEWSAEILRKHIDRPVYTVITGVDPDLYCETGPKFDLSKQTKGFTFLSVFGWNYRKGPDVLCRAYFDEFSEDDDVSLLIMSRYQNGIARHHREKIKFDIDEYMSEFPNKAMPHLVRFGQMLPEKDMPKLYRACDAFVLPSRGEGGCCLPGTPIITNNGITDIEEVKIEDKVLTHTSMWQKVTKIMKREVHEPVFSFSVMGDPQEKIRLTSEHPILILKREDCWSDGRKILEKFRLDNCKWLRADEVHVGDYVVSPMNFASLGIEMADTVRFLDQNDFIEDEGSLWKSTCSRLGRKYKHPNAKPFPNKLIFDEQFLSLLGLYIAEGYTNKNKVTFSFHKDETLLHNKIIQSLAAYNQTAKKSKSTGKGVQICCSGVMSSLLSKLCGNGSKNKHLPEFVWSLSRQQIKDLLWGVFVGDGCFTKLQNKNLPYLTLTTHSDRLAAEVKIALRMVGVNSCRYKNKNGSWSVNIKGEDINGLTTIKNSNFTGEIKRYCVKNENSVFIPVQNIEQEEYVGYVYNLEVENDHSYATTSFAVHNCLPPLEASLCGLPVIMTNVSGQQGYLKSDNAYLIEMDRLEEVTTGQFGIHYWDGQKFPALRSPEVHQQLRKAMRSVYENHKAAKQRNKRLQKLILEKFTWNNTANQATERLESIAKKMRGEA